MSKDAISPSGATDPQGQLRSPVEKQEPLRVEAENEQDLKGGLDYSGAHEKVDPREIALVKKLDRWMMPILWLMYWLNYLVCDDKTDKKLNQIVANSRSTGPQRHHARAP